MPGVHGAAASSSCSPNRPGDRQHGSAVQYHIDATTVPLRYHSPGSPAPRIPRCPRCTCLRTPAVPWGRRQLGKHKAHGVGPASSVAKECIPSSCFLSVVMRELHLEASSARPLPAALRPGTLPSPPPATAHRVVHPAPPPTHTHTHMHASPRHAQRHAHLHLLRLPQEGDACQPLPHNLRAGSQHAAVRGLREAGGGGGAGGEGGEGGAGRNDSSAAAVGWMVGEACGAIPPTHPRHHHRHHRHMWHPSNLVGRPTSGSTMCCGWERQISWMLWMKALGVILACGTGAVQVSTWATLAVRVGQLSRGTGRSAQPARPATSRRNDWRAAVQSQPARRHTHTTTHTQPQPHTHTHTPLPTCLGMASCEAMALASMYWAARSWACLILEYDSGRMPGLTCSAGQGSLPGGTGGGAGKAAEAGPWWWRWWSEGEKRAGEGAGRERWQAGEGRSRGGYDGGCDSANGESLSNSLSDGRWRRVRRPAARRGWAGCPPRRRPCRRW